MATKQEADDHLREIRRRKGVDVSGAQQSDNVGDLNCTLKILSEQLYKKPTHFLLELIQNADDNHYDDDTPTISFELMKTAMRLRIDCNEVGFAKSNVDALCRIGSSTKTTSGRSRGYIGEKGIGFKSVFKVADLVWISSKSYSFQFDARDMLGMIVPIIRDFPPRQLLSNHTQMLLSIKSQADYDRVCEELRDLEPQILIFLRKLRRLSIKLPIGDQRVTRQFQIQRVLQDADLDWKETAILRTLGDDTKTEQRYVIVRDTTKISAIDERRENISETEIVLAFPVDKSMRPLLSDQQTYAYLPIDDYGFHYLIQGDFLLVANRESVDSSKWNIDLRTGVMDTFIWRAVPRFNDICETPSSLRYTWPLFLKYRRGTNQFWSNLKLFIFSFLAKERVLECRYNRELVRPNSLLYVPPVFRFSGEPLVEEERTRSLHLSFRYDGEIDRILPELKKMGVRSMAFSSFYAELCALISSKGNAFLTNQSTGWHSKVANLFVRHGSVSQIAQVPLIPLQDGRWVTTAESHLFLGEDISPSSVPDGLDIHVVDSKACLDSKRLTFFQWLGIRRCNRGEVCRMIMERYNARLPRTLAESVQDLVYLFLTPRTLYRGSLKTIILFPAPPFPEPIGSGTRIYIERPSTRSILSKYGSNIASNMPLVHPNYLAEIRSLNKEPEFIDWLCTHLRAFTYPKLQSHGQLTKEFKFLKANAVPDLLLLLRDYWTKYSDQLSIHVAGELSTLGTAISTMKVDCTDGVVRRLNETALPLGQLKIEGPDLPFIVIPEPDNRQWLRFSLFGVLTELSVVFYLRQLEALAARSVHDTTTKTKVQAAYTELESRLSRGADLDNTRRAFTGKKLVFIEALRKWAFLHDCVWTGAQLSSIHFLKSEYPLHKTLFRTYLKLGNVALEHVVKELEGATDITPFDRLESLLLLLNAHLKNSSPKDCLLTLKGKNIIPVREPDGSLSRRSYDKDVWYFADRHHLLQSFNGKLPLITFDVATVRTLNPLIDAMRLQNWKLSSKDKSHLKINGDKIYDEEKTMELRERAPHFYLLVRENCSRTAAELSTLIRTLKVWVVQAITRSHEVGGVVGLPDTGDILFDDNNADRLEIYVCRESTRAVIDHQLSEKFVDYCCVSDQHEKLVIQFLVYPLERIASILDENGLGQPADPSGSSEGSETANEDSNTENGTDNEGFTSSGTRTEIIISRTADQSTELGLGTSSGASFLRTRIPAFDERISSVRAAAAFADVAPIRILAPTQATNNSTSATPSSTPNSNSMRPQAAGFSFTSPTGETEEAGPTTPTTSAHRPGPSSGTFHFGDMNSALSEVFAGESSSRISNTSTHSRPSGARFNQSAGAAWTQPNPEASAEGIYRQYIGLQGEVFVNEWLTVKLGNDWDAIQHWTSRNRNTRFPESPFTGKEKDFADFTFPDGRGKLTDLLARYGFIHNTESWISSPPTYHLEVKSTQEACHEPFYMSNNQVEKARQYAIPSHANPSNVYVVFRVYNLDKSTPPDFTIYVDPWALYMSRQLNFMAQDTFLVTPNEHPW